MLWFRKKKRPIEIKFRKISFVCEQDGDIERNLKQKIVPLLEERNHVLSAYLVRATYDEKQELNVALCVRMEQLDDSSLRKAVFDIFSAMFNRQEHIDIIFIRKEQENELKQVCRAFYEKKCQQGVANFHEVCLRFLGTEGVSQELVPLVNAVYSQIHASPVDLPLLKKSLIVLISFLCQPEHRNDKNCHAVDMFFTVDDHWSVRWDSLPEDYKLVLDDIGGCLHDTISASTIAENFESTPEQLLKRIKQLKV